MNGILIIDKPAGITSHDVVANVRRILKTKRVGHTGTLDPFATGVMVILVGQATRLAQFLDKDEKEYEALIRFGFETDTGDRTGVSKTDDPKPKAVKIVEVEAALADFRGDIAQIPPMYSAKKIDGKKLYEHARKGNSVERKPIKVSINKLELLPPSPATYDEKCDQCINFGIRVVCSAGTYIRTLAEDIGRKLGVGAHLTELRRTRAGRFGLSQAVTLAALGEVDDPASILISMEVAVGHLASFTLTADRVEKTKNGMSTRISESKFMAGQPIGLFDERRNLIAVGFYEELERSIRPKVVLV